MADIAGTIYAKFKTRTGGTGTVTATNYLGTGNGTDKTPVEMRHFSEGMVNKVEILAPVYYDQADSAATTMAARLAASAYLDTLKNSLTFRPPVVHAMGRGRVYIPNIHDNFGDLVIESTVGGAETTALANCTLESADVAEDDGALPFVRVRLVFIKAAAANAI